MLPDINKKSVSVESIAKKVVNDRKLLDDLLEYTSSDKAVHPVNLYGATKMTAEKLPKKWDK